MSLGATMSAPGVGVAQGRPGERLDRQVVVDLAVAQDPAVSVGGVLAQAYVGDHDHLRHEQLDGGDRLLDLAARIAAGAARLVLVVGHPEQQDGRHAGLVGAGRPYRQDVRRHPRMSGHRADRLFAPGSVDREHRQDELIGREPVLAHHPSHGRGAPQPSGTHDRKPRLAVVGRRRHRSSPSVSPTGAIRSVPASRWQDPGEMPARPTHQRPPSP